MVRITEHFKKSLQKIKDNTLKDKVKKQILKISQNPAIGKPMRFARKGTREVYVKPFRISYIVFDEKAVLLDIYHKDEQ